MNMRRYKTHCFGGQTIRGLEDLRTYCPSAHRCSDLRHLGSAHSFRHPFGWPRPSSVHHDDRRLRGYNLARASNGPGGGLHRIPKRWLYPLRSGLSGGSSWRTNFLLLCTHCQTIVVASGDSARVFRKCLDANMLASGAPQDELLGATSSGLCS